MELFAGNFEVQALRDENQWLLQCLHVSEQTCKQLQSAVKQQQRRIKQLEKASATTTNQPDAAQLERQWNAHLQQKEKEWMQEYGTQMQSLLRIIQHHESVRARLESELREARNAAADYVSSATQTDFSSDDNEVEEDVEDAGVHGSYSQEVAHDARCSLCCHAKRVHETEAERSAHPFVVQELLQRLQISSARPNQTDGFNEVLRNKRFTQLSPNNSSTLDFRASVLQRLRRQSRHSLLSQSRARSLPPTIPEEGEDKDGEQEDMRTTAKDPNDNSSQREAAPPSDAAASDVLFRSLEEQNQLLQDRLASQQSILDYLLSSKLHIVADNAMTATTATTTPNDTRITCQDQMIKLSDHFGISAWTNHRIRDSPGPDHPLSPSAA